MMIGRIVRGEVGLVSPLRAGYGLQPAARRGLTRPTGKIPILTENWCDVGGGFPEGDQRASLAAFPMQ